MNTREKFRVAAVQMTSGPQVRVNLEAAAKHIASAAAAGADLVALPEFFAMMGSTETDILAVMEAAGSGPIQTFLADQARQHGVWLLGGTIPIASDEPGRLRAASLLFDDQGLQVARYDKIHLFDVTIEGDTKRVYNESKTVQPGERITLLDTPFGRIGLAVCYDLRFPEMFRAMATREMEICLLPTAFTVVTGKAHWEVLVRARAIENLCFMVAPAQTGCHASGRETYGDSMIVDPWGEVLERLPTGNGVIVHDIDRARTVELRDMLPVLNHTKFTTSLP